MNMDHSAQIAYEDFSKVDIRVGRVTKVEEFQKARKPSYKIQVDFGAEIGCKWSSVAARQEYTIEQMMNRIVVGVVNLPPRNIAGFMSEVLILGVPIEGGGLSLLQPSDPAILGGRVY